MMTGQSTDGANTTGIVRARQADRGVQNRLAVRFIVGSDAWLLMFVHRDLRRRRPGGLATAAALTFPT